MHLYNIEQFDLDCTYSKGLFWKDLKGPINKTDLIPCNDSVIQANSENLPFENESMGSIMYDPPFIISGATYKKSKSGCLFSLSGVGTAITTTSEPSINAASEVGW